jgi:hypothetical protein
MAAYALGLSPAGPLALPLGLWAVKHIQTTKEAGRPVAWSAVALGTIWCAGFALLLSIFLGSNKLHFEQAAVAELEQIWGGQQRFRAAAAVDQDGDRRGEFATFTQLGAGDWGVSKLFGTPGAGGVVRKYRYCFKLFLPGDPDGREQRFLVYAWPEVHGDSAVRAFLLDGRTGTIWHCSNGTGKAGRYSGLERQPDPGSAFFSLEPATAWPAATATPGPVAAGAPHDGEDWAQLKRAGG